jgi:hypothetical protein
MQIAIARLSMCSHIVYIWRRDSHGIRNGRQNMDLQNYIYNVKNAPSLSALCEAVNAASTHIVQNDLGDLDNYVDMSSLPTFGGAEPRDTHEIWSWDAEDLMMVGPDGKFVLVSREEWDEITRDVRVA